jgi:hypothetical protein
MYSECVEIFPSYIVGQGLMPIGETCELIVSFSFLYIVL